MIKNILFDFGGVLLPLTESKTWKAFEDLGAMQTLRDQEQLFHDYETGTLDTGEFLEGLQPFFFRKSIFKGDLARAWNAMLDTPLPGEVTEQLKQWQKKYRLFLLSNTNELHIQTIKEVAGPFDYPRFLGQFEKVYYSYRMGQRKPDPAIFETVLQENELKAEETFYIDDNAKNIRTAQDMGLKCWHFDTEGDAIRDLDKVLSKHHS